MKDYRLVQEKTIKYYDNQTGTLLFTISNKGIFRKKFYFILEDEPIGIAKKSFLRSSWKIELVEKQEITGIFKKPIFGKNSCIIETKKYSLVNTKGNKLEFKNTKNKTLGFTINKNLTSKNSIIIENNEYHNDLIVGMIACIFIIKNNII